MRVLSGIVIGAVTYRASMITGFPAPASARSLSVLASPRWYVGATCASTVGYWRMTWKAAGAECLAAPFIAQLVRLAALIYRNHATLQLCERTGKECEQMMIKLFGEPVCFDAMSRRRALSCSCLTAVISRLYCSLRLSGPVSDPRRFAVSTLWDRILICSAGAGA